MSRIRADLLLAFAAVIWGTAFIAQKNAGEFMGPISFVGVRFLLSCVALAPLALFERSRSGAPPLNKGDWSLAGLIGICVFVAAALQQAGLAATTAANGGFLSALYVISFHCSSSRRPARNRGGSSWSPASCRSPAPG